MDYFSERKMDDATKAFGKVLDTCTADETYEV